MRRREFITLLGGAAAAWPFTGRAQQPERVRRIGVLMNLTADNPQGKPQIAAFLEALQQLGWSDGRNVRIDIRWGTNDIDRQRGYAAELAALIPDVILASGTLSVVALQHVTHTGDVPNSVEIGRAVAAIDVATRLSVVRQDSGYAVDLMCAQIAR